MPRRTCDSGPGSTLWQLPARLPLYAKAGRRLQVPHHQRDDPFGKYWGRENVPINLQRTQQPGRGEKLIKCAGSFSTNRLDEFHYLGFGSDSLAVKA